MQLKLSNNLDRLTVLATPAEAKWYLELELKQTIEIAQFQDPKLLTDFAAISRLNPSLRDLVFALYGSYPREVVYDEVACNWTPHIYPGVWGPSIDTIWMAKCIKQFLSPEIKSIAEVGCGSGYLSKYIIYHAPSILAATLTDISLNALNCASDNIGDTSNAKVTYIMPHADDQTLGLNRRYDLIISNPPYIPRPNQKQNNPYEGLSVIHRLATNLEQVLNPDGNLFINIPTVSGDAPINWFKESGYEIKLIEEFRVPLKVNAVINNISPASKKWLNYLQDNNLIECAPNDPDYKWHQILRFYKVSL